MLLQLWEQLVVDAGVLYRRYELPEGSIHLQLVVPKVLQKDILEDLHKGVLGGHLGVEKMMG